MQQQPVVVAHRGFSSVAPENTLAAARAAIAEGATHLECDVHASADGTPYVIHDSTIERTTGQTGVVSKMSDVELDALEAGAWKSERFRGEPIPRLVQLLQLLRQEEICLALEVKARGLESQVIAALRATDFPLESLTVFAFDFSTLIEFRKRESHMHLTYLIDRIPDDSAWSLLLRLARSNGVQAVGPSAKIMNAQRVSEAHHNNLAVFVWTVDDAISMQKLAGWGVDAIITNDIALGRRILGSAHSQGRK